MEQKDIIMTERISGTPCTVINTPYVEKIGTKATWLETVLNKNKTLKKVGENGAILNRNEGHGERSKKSNVQNGLGRWTKYRAHERNSSC